MPEPCAAKRMCMSHYIPMRHFWWHQGSECVGCQEGLRGPSVAPILLSTLLHTRPMNHFPCHVESIVPLCEQILVVKPLLASLAAAGTLLMSAFTMVSYYALEACLVSCSTGDVEIVQVSKAHATAASDMRCLFNA